MKTLEKNEVVEMFKNRMMNINKQRRDNKDENVEYVEYSILKLNDDIDVHTNIENDLINMIDEYEFDSFKDNIRNEYDNIDDFDENKIIYLTIKSILNGIKNKDENVMYSFLKLKNNGVMEEQENLKNDGIMEEVENYVIENFGFYHDVNDEIITIIKEKDLVKEILGNYFNESEESIQSILLASLNKYPGYYIVIYYHNDGICERELLDNYSDALQIYEGLIKDIGYNIFENFEEQIKSNIEYIENNDLEQFRYIIDKDENYYLIREQFKYITDKDENYYKIREKIEYDLYISDERCDYSVGLTEIDSIYYMCIDFQYYNGIIYYSEDNKLKNIFENIKENIDENIELRTNLDELTGLK
ncbi:MAG: hypothetical protein ACOCP8_05430 [archaeon]